MNNQEKKVQDKINAKKIKGAPARGKKIGNCHVEIFKAILFQFLLY